MWVGMGMRMWMWLRMRRLLVSRMASAVVPTWEKIFVLPQDKHWGNFFKK